MPILRKLFISDKNGVYHEIRTQEDLQRILNQMTPEELERWKTQYRFTPIENRAGNYTGTIGDL